MKKRCPNCRLVNFPDSTECARCEFDLIEVSTLGATDANSSPSTWAKIFRRAVVCLIVCLFSILAFYLSMLFTSASLAYEEKKIVAKGIDILAEKGFEHEVFLLRHLTAYRSNDNWLNASTREETAYAATNFPFEIMTVYPEFFTASIDDTERAAVLLHEAQHLKGADEREAYEFVWRNRKRLGWTRDAYRDSVIWSSVKKQTREFAPNLFACAWVADGDCTE